MISILQHPNKILHKKAEEIPLSKITTPKIQKILREMKDVLHEEPDGVALAAPQIGYSLRIFVLCEPCFRDYAEIPDKKKKLQEERLKPHQDWVFINPTITKLSKKKKKMTEGCLSVRWKYGEVERAMQARVCAYDENGEKFERGASGLLAQAFQHEIDHLDGILFTDKAQNLRNLGV